MAKMAYKKKAAEIAGLSEYQLWRMTKEGKVPYIMSGNRFIYNIELLQESLRNLALANMKPMEEENKQYGVLRRINAD
jgi:hypothetical protein